MSQTMIPVIGNEIDMMEVKAVLFADYFAGLQAKGKYLDMERPKFGWGIYVITKNDMILPIAKTQDQESAKHWAQFFGTAVYCTVIDEKGNQYEHLEIT